MFDFQQISRYRENNRLEAKLATGGLPRSIWETYSAFANTYGGVILLGVEELPDHTLRVQGLLEPRELVDEFTALLQDPRVVSANLLTPGDIQVLHVDGGDIVAITVPPAEQDPPGGPGQGRPAVHGAEGDDQPQRERPDQGHEKQLQGHKKPLVQGYQYRLGHW